MLNKKGKDNDPMALYDRLLAMGLMSRQEYDKRKAREEAKAQKNAKSAIDESRRKFDEEAKERSQLIQIEEKLQQKRETQKDPVVWDWETENKDAIQERIVKDRLQIPKEQKKQQAKQEQKERDEADVWRMMGKARHMEEDARRLAEATRAKEAEARRREAETRRRLEEEERQLEKERIQKITSMELDLDWENAFGKDPEVQGIFAESISDALILSLTTLGRVDIEYISTVSHRGMVDVIKELEGAIYQNPETWEECFYRGWEPAEEYLTGNVLKKWAVAMEANKKYNGYFERNVKALFPLLPKTMATEDIYVTIGSPWIPADVIDDFIRHIFNIPPTSTCYSRAIHDPASGTWEITEKPVYKERPASRSTYGTKRLPMLNILERTLNMKTIDVMDEVDDPNNANGVRRVINKEETTAALEKQRKLIEEFRKWIWTDERRSKRLRQIYAETFGCIRTRQYDGSFLKFPGMSEDVELYPYQKNAVARILFSHNTLLAHDVGSGKTYIMIAAGMELRRMKLSEKNLYVVPNNLVGQWKEIFLTMYPQANILCIDPKTFVPQKRQEVLRMIRDGDYDGIIMAYSSFELIDLSQAYLIREMEEHKLELEQMIREGKRATSMVRRRAKLLEKKISEAVEKANDREDMVYFEQLGITRLFVDEAHNFKNVPIETQSNGVLGISAAGSRKCKDMMDKVHMIQRQNGGGGVIMATGTPITNSITDAFVMQKYLQSGVLATMDLGNFDSWIGMFAERVTDFEIDVDTSGYRLATRFAAFHNLPELTTLLACVADFHRVDLQDGIPDHDGCIDSLIPRTPAFAQYLQDITERAEEVRAGRIKRTEDNMLKITTDGRKAALDMRLVDSTLAPALCSKATACAKNVAKIYFDTADQSCTQLIFCDSSTPKEGFNLYDELRRILQDYGIPATQIAYIHDANTEKRRDTLFEKVRQGKIRILIGSTLKLGLGVNVQDKLIALHHLDVPWRPADMTQREGRILRQGNTNEKVYIYRYITEGSFDAYSWQLLETKQRFIVRLLSGSWAERSGTDLDDTVLNYAEVKALAVGNPLVKERVEVCNEISRLMTLQKHTAENRVFLEKERAELPEKIRHQQELVNCCKDDMAYYDALMAKMKRGERKELRQKLFNAVQDNVLQREERLLMDYHGFELILPSNMIAERPFVWLRRKGRYLVELGDVEISYLARVDHVLDGLPKHLDKLNGICMDLEQRLENVNRELAKNENYSDQIQDLKVKLQKIDKELGVSNQ